ncbi:MAG TPA: hypothetical protein VI503_00250 [Gaiellaceae bacterium]|nr:hypothetical protein [Gaiellaceae bacterium]HLF67743.1 hypothetical protein [Gaiellaceae bacterium]
MRRLLARLASLALSAVLLSTVLATGASGSSNAVVASATGSGHMTRNGFNRTFSFQAQKFADGTTRGQLELLSREFDVVIHLAVDCLRVVGNRAHLSGLITFTSNTDEAFVGELNRLVVEDNGEGRAAPPDMVSGIPANPGNANPETCETNTLTPNRVVERGNVQVHGG